MTTPDTTTDRAHRIRAALIEAMSRWSSDAVTLCLAADAPGEDPLTWHELDHHLASIGAEHRDGRWRLSVGPPRGWEWRDHVNDDGYLLLRCPDPEAGYAIVYPPGDWIVRGSLADSHRVMAEDVATPPTLPAAQAAALLEARRRGLFGAMQPGGIPAPVVPVCDAPGFGGARCQLKANHVAHKGPGTDGRLRTWRTSADGAPPAGEPVKDRGVVGPIVRVETTSGAPVAQISSEDADLLRQAQRMAWGPPTAGEPVAAPPLPARCWKCGGKPLDDPRFKRPICATCLWNLIKALAEESDNGE